MYVILFFQSSVLFQDLIFFQDSGISSYVGLQDYKISSLFQDLASMNKTLSISVGLNSHAGNRQDTTLHALPGETQHKNNTGTLNRSKNEGDPEEEARRAAGAARTTRPAGRGA